ncbi:RHS repeat-associated core domain-containing protein [Pseudomonas sp. 15FMM2]|uniref:RHS repeat-associated core domain-containing protein n=1 Tax=Pseudomonas imrae TaxID=2992837 RepID=A0ACC7PBP9_9PSED
MSSSFHKFTPSLVAHDPRGLIVRNVDYHRSTVSDPPQPHIRRQVYGSTGLMIEQWDPRLFQLQRSQPATLPNQRTVYSLGGQALRTDSVDAGWQLMLPGGAGQVLDVWDGRGSHQAHRYDQYLRVVAVFEQAAGDAQPQCVERLGYGVYSVAEAALNRCGRVIRHDDGGGSVFHERYGIHGEVALQTRRFRQVAPVLDWPQPEEQRDARLEPEGFATTAGFNALGECLHHTDAKGNRVEYDYGVDGQSASVFLLPKGGVRKCLVDQHRYNAAGHLLRERAANGVVCTLHYHPLDGRLRKLTAQLPGDGGQLQDLEYDYDRVGNIVRIEDREQVTQWSRNTRVGAASTYEYDTLSRLIKASGRETAGNSGRPALPGLVTFGSTDDSVWRRYTQHFRYDQAGNLLQLRHVPSSGVGYTRTMTVGAHSNHFLPEVDGAAAPGLGEGYDRCGNLQVLEGVSRMEWGVRNQLTHLIQIARQGEGDDEERYEYDAAGQRIRKRRLFKASGRIHTAEVRYLPGLEIRHDSATGEQLNVLNLAVGTTTVRVLQWDRHPSGVVQPAQIRFGLTDQLGSNTLELDEQAQRISHESYYPYGGTAWWAAKNASEADYKFIRYSGKERDTSGLYYYGFRYYAPWLCRWISPDPASDIDGLNLYAMVGGNPVTQTDDQGLATSTPTHVSLFRRLRTIPSRIASRIQAAGSAAIRDGLSTYLANAIAAVIDVAIFGNIAPTAAGNQALRYSVAALDALAVIHMSTGIAGRWTRYAPLIGLIAGGVAGAGYAGHAQSLHPQTEEGWDPVARLRLAGHVRSFSRELIQQVIRGHGSGYSWGTTPLRGRVARTSGATAAYAVATIGNTLFGEDVPLPLVPNVTPFVEAYDAAAGTLIRSGHATAVADAHGETLQFPDPEAMMHGGLSRMLSQVWGYWASTAIEALVVHITGLPMAGQRALTRTFVMVARGVTSALTEFRGFLVQGAREGYSNLVSSWSRPRVTRL